MSEQQQQKQNERPDDDPQPKIPREHVLEMRRLVHEMGNALEIIVQTNYLLNMAEADDSTKQWLKMMDTGIRQASEISKEMRQYLMLHTALE